MMARRRWLPANVTPYQDRHGKTRYRYRKTGHPPHHFKAQPGTEEFRREYEEARNARRDPAAGLIPYSYDALIASFYQTPKWVASKASTKATYRNIIERFRAKNGHKDVRGVHAEAIDKILSRMVETPSAANNLRKVLKRLHRHAVKLRWRTDNPADYTEILQTPKGGWHTWSDDEIKRYRAHHAYGTMARLTLELALNTAARRCNLSELERDNLKDGRWQIAHVKGNDETFPLLTAETRKAIEALPAAPIRYFITGAKGKPYTPESLSNRFRIWAREAGCPTNIHGLRKGVSRQLAEHGATDLEGMAMTGHKKDATFRHYAAKASRTKLADAAQAKLVGEPDLANPKKSND